MEWGLTILKRQTIINMGEEGKQVYENFPVKIGRSHISGKTGQLWRRTAMVLMDTTPAEAWTDFEAMKTGFTESAAASTALATGKKTYNNAIGMDLDTKDKAFKFNRIRKTIRQIDRSSYKPFNLATQRRQVLWRITCPRKYCEEIAQEMILDSKCSVIMGTGDPMYDDNSQIVNKDAAWVGGKELWGQLTARTKNYVYNKRKGKNCPGYRRRRQTGQLDFDTG